jgi:hypothetical protein
MMNVLDSETIAIDPVIAFHEAGHAAAAVVLGLGFLLKEVRVVAHDGRGPGTDLCGDAVPRGCTTKPEEVSEAEWQRLQADPAAWNDWIERDHDKFAIYYLAGEAAQHRYAPDVMTPPHKTDHSNVERLVPSDRVPRLREEAHTLIATHRSAVERIASALLRRHRLTGEEVKTLIG